jgi:hypothetical protein
MRAGDTMTIPGFLNKVRIQIQRLGPRSAAVAVAAKLNQV